SGKYPQAKILLFSQKQKTKNRNLKLKKKPNLHSVIPTKVGIQDAKSQETVIRHSRAGGNPVRWVSLVLSFG
ncbi:hypothetical protein, partial [Neisseria meningitidis]|uniref:hypothetical protein n=1 Tax=Neisseria meningitidis TaxID=487 RepID=UPI001E4059E6